MAAEAAAPARVQSPDIDRAHAASAELANHAIGAEPGSIEALRIEQDRSLVFDRGDDRLFALTVRSEPRFNLVAQVGVACARGIEHAAPSIGRKIGNRKEEFLNAVPGFGLHAAGQSALII